MAQVSKIQINKLPQRSGGMNPNGNIKHGQHGTLTYMRWKSMMQRCYSPSATNFKYYGAKGVDVCERWHDFPSFLTDMGECPGKGMTLDRVRNDLGYEPGNCRWVTQAEQNRNRGHCIQITHNGKTMIASDWAREIGIVPNVLLMRLRNGWTTEEALTTPPGNRRPKP
jgi:hypothetical protein